VLGVTGHHARRRSFFEMYLFEVFEPGSALETECAGSGW